MTALPPRFTINNAITAGLTAIERARGFLEAATLSEEWLRRMSQRALLLTCRPSCRSSWAWIGRQSSIHPVLVAGMAKFHLMHIHPFLGDNGRASRSLRK